LQFGKLYPRESRNQRILQQPRPEIARSSFRGNTLQDCLHVVVGTVVLQSFPQIAPRGRPVVYEKGLESTPVQIETIQTAKIVVEGKHVENATATRYGQFGVLLLLGFDILAEFFLFGQRGQGQEHLGRAQVVLAHLPEGFLIDGLAALANVLEGILGHRSEENRGCKTENPEYDEEREKHNAPKLTLVK